MAFGLLAFIAFAGGVIGGAAAIIVIVVIDSHKEAWARARRKIDDFFESRAGQ